MKQSLIIFPVFLAAALISISAPSYAIVYKYNRAAPAVDLDMGVIGEEQPQQSLPPVEGAPFQDEGQAVPAETTGAAPVAPAPKKLSAPFFTAPSVIQSAPPAETLPPPPRESSDKVRGYVSKKVYKVPEVPMYEEAAPVEPVPAPVMAEEPVAAPLPVISEPVLPSPPVVAATPEMTAVEVETMKEPVASKEVVEGPSPPQPFMPPQPEPQAEKPQVKAVTAKPKPVKRAPEKKEAVAEAEAVPVETKQLSSAEMTAEEKLVEPETVAEAVVEAAAQQPAPAETPEAEAKPAEAPPAPEAASITPAEAKAEVPSVPDLTLDFAAASSEISPAAQKKLNTLALQLQEAMDTRLQIRAYAQGDEGGQSSARRMALSRGLMVRAYLTEKGIKPARLDVRALGAQTDRQPLDRVDLILVR